jgi:bifunctional DNA-binding transcriptional regulator/antitoxin component of YhaV-PrlF toxin-antitoxin module
MRILTSTLTSKGQTTVPEAARVALPLKPGQRLSWEINNGYLTVRPIRDINQLAGCLKSGQPSVSVENMKKVAREARVKHAARKRETP